ncbi:hypothetical protein ACHWQZ_G004433 [Mnemiopsis leidyi]
MATTQGKMKKFCQNVFMFLIMVTTTSIFFLALFSLMKVTQTSQTNSTANSTSSEECNLTDSFGFLIQFLLATIAFSILVLKRYREPKYERRSVMVWLLDVSKQAIGAGFIHVFNVLASQLFFSNQDPCSLYFVNMFIDMTVGLLILYGLISLSRYLLRDSSYAYLKSGEYGNPPQAKAWLAQCGIYLLIMIIQKLLVSPLVLIPFWTTFREFLFSPLKGHGKLEVVVVMLIVPLFVNAFMFWVQDNILMRRKRSRAPSSHIEARVNLLEAEQVELREVLTPS